MLSAGTDILEEIRYPSDAGRNWVLAIRINQLPMVALAFGRDGLQQVVTQVKLSIAHWLGSDAGLESPMTGHFTCPVPRPLIDGSGSSYRSIQSMVDGLSSTMLAIGSRNSGPVPLHPSISMSIAANDRSGMSEPVSNAARAAAVALLGPDCAYAIGDADLGAAAARYRSDLSTASILVRWIASGEIHALWRPIRKAGPSEAVLGHTLDGLLPKGAGSALTVDDVQPLFARLGLAPLLDRHLVRLAIDRLRMDPLATALVRIDAQSINDSFLWSDCLDRLREDRNVAARMIFSIGGRRNCDPAIYLRRFAKDAREAGIRIAIRDFGAGDASWQDILCVGPEIVELSPSLARLAPSSERGREALAALLMFLNASGRWQIVTSGIDSELAAEVAADCGASWMAGTFCGGQRTGYPFYTAS